MNRKQKRFFRNGLLGSLLVWMTFDAQAQEVAGCFADSLPRSVRSEAARRLGPREPVPAKPEQPAEHSSRLRIGGYGEVVMQRMFYSENIQRYSYPDQHRDAKSFGRFDLPHFVVYMAYDFGRGWSMSSEIEFEHGGGGSAYEIENAESGEYETEIEKGGEVALEQFWIQKSWKQQFNLRFGHMVVPVGITNRYHMPTEYFTVLRPEGEMTILPCTWHETGASFWGRAGKWRYEVQFLAGLDAERFNNANWIQGGSTSPYEFSVANSYALAFRLDNWSVEGLRWALSGYYGNSSANSLKREQRRFDRVKGAVAIGAFDATYDDHNVLARANFVYGHLGDAAEISAINISMPPASPSPRTGVASDAMTWFVEAGYDLLSLFPKRRYAEDKLYLYVHYGCYDSMYKVPEGVTDKPWTERSIFSVGFDYRPIKGLVVKGEYSDRMFRGSYSNEPTISLGIGFSCFYER